MAHKEGLLIWSGQNDFSSSGRAFPLTAFTSDTTGWPIVVQAIAFLANNMRRLGGQREAELWLTSVTVNAILDAPNAFSFNPVTGLCYCSNKLVFSYDPSLDHGFFATNVAKAFTASTPSLYYNAAIDKIEAPMSGNLTGGALLTLINSFNPGRTVVSAATAVSNLYVMIGLISK